MDTIFCICPCCGLNRVLIKRAKGRVRFDLLDPESSAFIDVRVSEGGRRFATKALKQEAKEQGETGGFRRVSSLPLREARDDPQYADLIDQLRTQARRILEVLG